MALDLDGLVFSRKITASIISATNPNSIRFFAKTRCRSIKTLFLPIVSGVANNDREKNHLFQGLLSP